MQEPVTGTIQTCWPFFQNLRPSLLRDLKSTKGSRNPMRVNVISEIINSKVETFNPKATIPLKVAQVACSSFALVRMDTKAHEKLLHLFQASIALAQLTLSILTFVNHSTCTVDSAQGLCAAVFILDWFYTGFLLAGWGMSELSKMPGFYQQQAQQRQNQSQETPVNPGP